MKPPLNFDNVIKIKQGHMRHGIYYVTDLGDESGFYWFLHESPNDKLPGEKCDDENVNEYKAHIAIKIESPIQLYAIADKMIRDAKDMEYIMKQWGDKIDK